MGDHPEKTHLRTDPAEEETCIGTDRFSPGRVMDLFLDTLFIIDDQLDPA